MGQPALVRACGVLSEVTDKKIKRKTLLPGDQQETPIGRPVHQPIQGPAMANDPFLRSGKVPDTKVILRAAGVEPGIPYLESIGILRPSSEECPGALTMGRALDALGLERARGLPP